MTRKCRNKTSESKRQAHSRAPLGAGMRVLLNLGVKPNRDRAVAPQTVVIGEENGVCPQTKGHFSWSDGGDGLFGQLTHDSEPDGSTTSTTTSHPSPHGIFSFLPRIALSHDILHGSLKPRGLIISCTWRWLLPLRWWRPGGAWIRHPPGSFPWL